MRERKGDKSLENIRHTLAHLLASAVLEKRPGAKLGIGPTIENGFYYDFDLKESLTPNDLPELEKVMRDLIKQNLKIVGTKVTPVVARKLFKDQPYKLDLIKDFVKEKKQLTVYKTGNIFSDLCKGGHIQSTKEINPDAFKLTHLAGAYWKGDEKNAQLQRVYGVAFATKKELDHYLWQQEEAKKRDHRILGKELKLFTFADEVGPGLPLWLPRGTVIRDEIEKYAKQVEEEWGYQRVSTPHIAKEDLYRMSGHIPYYKDDMYPPMKLDDGNYYLKAMNCPHTHMIYKSEPRSYRDLPLRFAEYGTVYRYELSGVLAGLLRVRGFSQNDAHIYCREDQVVDEFLKVMKLHEFWYKKVFGISDFYMRLSLPDKDKTKYADMPTGWKKAVTLIRKAMKLSGLPYVEVTGEAAFYGPKVDFQIKSAIGREESASTNQLDFLATERFNLTYKDETGKDKSVYVIHRAPLGSHERFIAFLIEHYAGVFPLWLSPIQAQIIAVSDKFQSYAQKISDQLRAAGVRVELTQANETLGKRIREGETQKIPYLLIVGEKEKKAGTVAVRKHGKGDLGTSTISTLIKSLQAEITQRK